MKNDSYLLALHSVDGLGPIRLKAILDYFKDPKLAWEADSKEIREIGVPQPVVDLLKEARKKLAPQTYATEIEKSGIKWLTVFDNNYPELLSQIYDPPVVLYYKGEILPSDKKAIGVVGSRKMTGYGKAVTEDFTSKLVAAGLTIVSGLARGVDSTAHKQAVNDGGRTIAVLGGGLNNIFPPENTPLAEKIASGFGAVVSEFPPGYPSLPGNFPARNRIIAGLSKAVLVTEAAVDSGSLITARLAVEAGREVFAVPGPVTSSLSRGPIDLIKEGARVVFDPQEILDELRITRVANSGNNIQIEKFSEEEKKILEVLERESLHVDEIGRLLQFPSGKLSALLLKMEISGLVQSLGAGVYCKS